MLSEEDLLFGKIAIDLNLLSASQLERITSPYEFGLDLYLQATIAAQLGDLDRAMVLLREAHARGRPFGVLLHCDMDLEPLRDYPPFQEFSRPKG